eukprot:1146823-Pelagomonas_calceolata.AAC.4
MAPYVPGRSKTSNKKQFSTCKTLIQTRRALGTDRYVPGKAEQPKANTTLSTAVHEEWQWVSWLFPLAKARLWYKEKKKIRKATHAWSGFVQKERFHNLQARHQMSLHAYSSQGARSSWCSHGEVAGQAAYLFPSAIFRDTTIPGFPGSN